MTRTVINQNIEQAVIGYMLNTTFDRDNLQAIAKLQQEIAKEHGDTLWFTPPEALHITLLDWLAPLIDYGENKEALFKKTFGQYDKVLTQIIGDEKEIEIHFDDVKAGPEAVFIIGHDDGQFARIRNKYLQQVTLLPNTKLPPAIIHSTLARFVKEVELAPIETLVAGLKLDVRQPVKSFRLTRETVDPLLNFTVIKEYPTKS